MINPGDLVQDKISGLKGVADARTVYLYDEPSIRVVRREIRDDGNLNESIWLPEKRLKIIQEFYEVETSGVDKILATAEKGQANVTD